MLHEFLRWTQKRIFKRKEKFDKKLDDVSSSLFPEVEPIMWAKILTLLARPWTNNDRMKSLVENGRNFGLTSRIMVGDFESTEKSSEKLHQDMRSQEDATLELALILFKHEFTKEKLSAFIADLKKLKYNKETRENARRKDFVLIFKKMVSLLEPKKSKTSRTKPKTDVRKGRGQKN